MKAVVYREFGGPEVLHCEEVATPAPGPGEILVKVLAVAIDYIQLHVRRGGSGRIGSAREQRSALARIASRAQGRSISGRSGSRT